MSLSIICKTAFFRFCDQKPVQGDENCIDTNDKCEDITHLCEVNLLFLILIFNFLARHIERFDV